MNAISLILSFSAIVTSVFQYIHESKRKRCEATINAFDELEESIFGKSEYEKIDIENVLAIHRKAQESSDDPDEEKKIDEEWHRLTQYLARIEHFSVGVNCEIYDVNILRRMAKSYLLKQWDKLLPIIEQKRREKSSHLYSEFESMVNSLRK